MRRPKSKRSATKSPHASHHTRLRQLEDRVLGGIALRGELTLAEAAQLSASDLRALADHAEGLRRRGDITQAAHVYELLVTFDPYEPQWWHRTQDLQLRCGNAEAAMMASHMIELLDAEDAASRSRAALCAAQLGL